MCTKAAAAGDTAIEPASWTGRVRLHGSKLRLAGWRVVSPGEGLTVRVGRARPPRLFQDSSDGQSQGISAQPVEISDDTVG